MLKIKLSAYEMLLWTQGHSKNRYEAFSRYRIQIQPCCLSRLWLIFNGCQLFELEKLNYGKVERTSQRSVFNLNRLGLRWQWRLENKLAQRVLSGTYCGFKNELRTMYYEVKCSEIIRDLRVVLLLQPFSCFAFSSQINISFVILDSRTVLCFLSSYLQIAERVILWKLVWMKTMQSGKIDTWPCEEGLVDDSVGGLALRLCRSIQIRWSFY